MTEQNEGFNNHQEMWEYLIGGGEICLRSDKNVRVKLENGNANTPYNIGAPAFWRRYEQPKWYENIPKKGVLCKVWGTLEKQISIMLVVERREKTYIDNRGRCWPFAEPLTYEEAVALIYKPLDT